ncbi:MAG: hypothetical protein HDS67_02235 [Bacteroidales bacterium]|nr:hypothetical protein [Bacteroidales bacterium]
MDLNFILSIVTTFFTAGGLGMLLKSSRRKSAAEARLAEANAKIAELSEDKAQFERYQAELDQMHRTQEIANNHIKELTEQRAVSDARYEEQTQRLRKTQDALAKSQSDLLQEQRESARLRLLNQFLKNWLCKKEFKDCGVREPEQEHKVPYIEPEYLNNDTKTLQG